MDVKGAFLYSSSDLSLFPLEVFPFYKFISLEKKTNDKHGGYSNKGCCERCIVLCFVF